MRYLRRRGELLVLLVIVILGCVLRRCLRLSYLRKGLKTEKDWLTHIRFGAFLWRHLNDLICCSTDSEYVFWWFHYVLYNAINYWLLAYISKARTIIIIRWETIMTIFWMMFLNWALDKVLWQRLGFNHRVSRKCLLNFVNCSQWLIKFDRIIRFMNRLNRLLIEGDCCRRSQTLNWVPHLIHLRVNLILLRRRRCLWNLWKRILPLHNFLLHLLLLYASLLHNLSD